MLAVMESIMESPDAGVERHGQSLKTIAANVRPFTEALGKYLADTESYQVERIALTRRLAVALNAADFVRVLAVAQIHNATRNATRN